MKGMLRNKYCRSVMAALLTLALIFGAVGINGYEADAASKPAFQKKKLTLAEGKTVKLKIKKMPKKSKILKTKWKVQKKSILKLTLSGSKAKKKKAKTAKIKALKAGKSSVYCTVTYRVKKNGKWKSKKSKAKATITVPESGITSASQMPPDTPSGTENPGENVSAAPGDTTNPGGTINPGETTDPSGTVNPEETTDPNGTTNPGVTTDPGETTNPGVTTDPNETTNPGVTTDPNGTANPGGATSKPTATPMVTPKPSPVTLTWTGTLVRPQWTSTGDIPGSFSQSSSSSGLKVASNAGCWYFDISCTNWNQYQYPVLKCYRLEGDTTTDALEVWYGSDDAGKVTYPFGEWNGKAITLDKEKLSKGIKISNYTPIGKIEICEGEAPAGEGGDVDVGSQDFSKTAMEFSKELKIGWNLGNTLDSIINNGAYVSGDAGLAAETAWSCPKATEGLIKAVKDAGFNTIRVPVTWTNHTDPNNDYKIDEVWMDRVEEVVQYCTKNGLYVILNIHHDGNDNPAGSKSWLTPEPADETAKAEMKLRYQKVWEQIATRFKDYSNLVLFSSMNEFHHGYGNPTTAYTNLQNELHQMFVNTVRATGGNNAQRYLIVPGYNTNIDQTISGLKLPTDSVENHLMVEVHYYDPYQFATDGNETDQWGAKYGGATAADGWGQEDYLIDQLKKMKTAFVDKGIPVIVGEFGAPAKRNSANEKYRTYYLQYVVKYAVEYGFVPIYWDNGTSYKLFDRGTYAVVYPDIVNGMMAALVPGYTIPLPQ